MKEGIILKFLNATLQSFKEFLETLISLGSELKLISGLM
jgi:hypothetical protein